MSEHLLHSTELDVRWGDLDAFNHVNNANYLRYLEEARVQWLHTLVSDWDDVPAVPVQPVVVNVSNNYRGAVAWPARLRVDLSVGRISERSLTLNHRLVDAGHPDTVYGDGHVVMVWISRHSGQAVPLPEPIRTLGTTI
jgi:acyl-CoA thioester hydrolase